MDADPRLAAAVALSKRAGRMIPEVAYQHGATKLDTISDQPDPPRPGHAQRQARWLDRGRRRRLSRGCDPGFVADHPRRLRLDERPRVRRGPHGPRRGVLRPDGVAGRQHDVQLRQGDGRRSGSLKSPDGSNHHALPPLSNGEFVEIVWTTTYNDM